MDEPVDNVFLSVGYVVEVHAAVLGCPMEDEVDRGRGWFEFALGDPMDFVGL